MDQEVLVSKSNDGIVYTLYCGNIPVMGEYTHHTKGTLKQEMMIKAYGITTLIPLGREKLLYDSGYFSGKGYRANHIYHKLIASGLKNLDDIRAFVGKEYNKQCMNQFGNPFTELANVALKRSTFKKPY